jgi:hypothetical protein
MQNYNCLLHIWDRIVYFSLWNSSNIAQSCSSTHYTFDCLTLAQNWTDEANCILITIGSKCPLVVPSWLFSTEEPAKNGLEEQSERRFCIFWAVEKRPHRGGISPPIKNGAEGFPSHLTVFSLGMWFGIKKCQLFYAAYGMWCLPSFPWSEHSRYAFRQKVQIFQDR